MMRTLVALAAVAAASAFAPGAMTGLRLKSAAAVSRRPATSPKMSLDAIEGAQQLLAVAQNVPFVDEVTGEPQGFTAPLNHFASVIGLWVLFALPVWSAAYKQGLGAGSPSWFGISQVAEDAPGIGLVAKAAPEYNGPTFREGLDYVFSFLWKPPILIAWRPRADLVLEEMDPSRDTVVSSLYKGFGGASDKEAVYDEEDQLLILSDIVTFEETPLGQRRNKIAEDAGWFTGNPSFGKSLIEYSEETRKGKRDFGTVTISAEELKKLRA